MYLVLVHKMDPKTMKKVRHALMCFSKVNPVMCSCTLIINVFLNTDLYIEWIKFTTYSSL